MLSGDLFLLLTKKYIREKPINEKIISRKGISELKVIIKLSFL